MSMMSDAMDEDWGDENASDMGWDDDEQDANTVLWSDDEQKSPLESWKPGEDARLHRGDSFEIIPRSVLYDRQAALLARVTEQLYLPSSVVFVLLMGYQWDADKLTRDWLDDSAKVLTKLGQSGKEYYIPTHSIECNICSSTVDGAEALALGCGHEFCLSCWRSWLNAETDKGPASVFTKCPGFKCTEIVSQELAITLLQEDKRDKFRVWTLDNLVSGARALTWCPTAGCGLAVEYKAGGAKEIDCSCGSMYCFKCSQEAHRPALCEEVEQWMIKNSRDSENINWIVANTKRCPKCNVHIEKNQGCNHMTCRSCTFSFCWLCKGAWEEHGSATGGYYKCNRFNTAVVSDSAKAEEQQAQEARNALDKYMFYFTRFDNHAKSIKFAEATRSKAEEIMGELQDKMGTNYQDVQFVLNATNAVIRCRRVLKWTYVFGYYLEGANEKNLFENHQERLEKFTEDLHGLTEKPIEELLEIKLRTQIVGFTRVVEKVLSILTGIND